jgi:hypothetical protein
MFNGHKVVVCVPSGRYRYLRVLLPYLLAERNNVIDEIQLWVNTDIQSDLNYFVRAERIHPKIKRILQTGPLIKALYDPARDHWQFNDGIHRFYRLCVESNTVYVKIDDDICYIHDDFFTHLLSAVLDRAPTNYACVANVFNVPHVTLKLQEMGLLDDKLGRSTGNPRCPHACTDGQFAAHIHRQFLPHAQNDTVDKLYFESHPITGRNRIGVMAWTGANFAAFGGVVGPRDEVELTTRIPESLGKPLWMVGNAAVCHFAFSHQRAHLEDDTDILDQYLTLSVRLNGDIAA